MKDMMKIYEIGTGYTPIPAKMGAATEIVVEALTKALLKQGADVEIIDIAAKTRSATALPIREVKVPGRFAGTDVSLGMMHKLKRVVYSVALAGYLKKLLKEAREPVVLHFHNQYNLFFFLKLVSSKLRKKAVILYTVHSYIWSAPWESIRETVKKKYFQEVCCLRNADHVLVLNDQAKETFVKQVGVDPKRLYKLDNGVDTDMYYTLEETQVEAFMRSMGLEGKTLLLQVGSVCDRKNQLGAIRDLAEYLRKNPDTVYVYAGGIIDEEYQRNILNYASQAAISDQVIYAGELSPGEELNRYYNAALAMIFPSRLEAFSLVTLEALSAGTPVLLTGKPVPGLEEGFLVYHSQEELETLLAQLCNTPTDREVLRQKTVCTYSWERIARDISDLLARRE